MSSGLSEGSEATAAAQIEEIQPCPNTLPAEVLKRTSLELPTYSRASSSKSSRFSPTRNKIISELPSSNGKIVDIMNANPSSDEELRPLIASRAIDADSAIEVVMDAGVAQPAKKSIFSVSYRTARSKEKLDKQTETDFSGLGYFLRWAWGGSRYSGIVCMALSSLIYSIMGLLVELFAGSQLISEMC